MTPHVSVIKTSVSRLLPPLLTIVAEYLGGADPIDALYIDFERHLQSPEPLVDPSGYTAEVRRYVKARDEHPGHGRPSDMVMFFHQLAPHTWDANGIRDRLLQPLAYTMWRVYAASGMVYHPTHPLRLAVARTANARQENRAPYPPPLE